MIAGLDFVIRPFRAEDQRASKRLILDGLAGHFGDLHPSLNSDLDDILTHYIAAGHMFIVAELDEKIIGTGALVRELIDQCRLVRISTLEEFRRRGIARALVSYLISEAEKSNFCTINVETNLDWTAAIELYKKSGFQIIGSDETSYHFQLRLL